MANLEITKQWVEDIWRVELDTPWVGTEEGTANIHARQLGSRTAFLKDFADEVAAARESEPSLLARIKKTGVEPFKIMAKFAYIPDTPVTASTANVDIVEGGLLTVDGIDLAVGDLVFLKNQTDKRENGFWEVQTGAWNRYDGYTSADVDCFTYRFIYMKAGETNAGKVFFLDRDVYALGASELEFRESLFSPDDQPGKVLLRDQEGKSAEDKKREEAIRDMRFFILDHADQIDGMGRSLLDVMGIGISQQTVQQATQQFMGEMRGLSRHVESGRDPTPDYRYFRIGDYLDLPFLDDGTTTYQWNDEYKNLRIVLSGFNHFKGSGDTEMTKNHILFTFRNCVLTKQMNPSHTNDGGYAASALCSYLDGVFALGLKNVIGDYILPVRRLLSTRGEWAWSTHAVFLPTEYEVFGAPIFSEIYQGGGFQAQIPIFRYTEYKCKRHNGSRAWWWTANPSAFSSASNFCNVSSNLNADNNGAAYPGVVAPALCAA
jgi:hypothetical protein